MKVAAALKALRLIGPDNTVSLSTLALYTAIVKLAISPADLPTIAALLIALANWNLKKWFDKNRFEFESARQSQADQKTSELEAIKSELKTLTQIVNLKR